jgi:hypothetical protein
LEHMEPEKPPARFQAKRHGKPIKTGCLICLEHMEPMEPTLFRS